MKKLHTILGLAACLAVAVLATDAKGDFVLDGQIERLAGAPVGTPNYGNGNVTSSICHLYFTVNATDTVNIDLLSWEVGGTGWTDVNGDGEDRFIDPLIYLFNDDGSLDSGDLITGNDDSSLGTGDGSISTLDSYLSLTLAAGDYILTVGGYSHNVDQAIAGFNPGSSGSGYYPINSNLETVADGDFRVTMTGGQTILTRVEHGQIPEPTSAAILATIGGLVICRRRK